MASDSGGGRGAIDRLRETIADFDMIAGYEPELKDSILIVSIKDRIIMKNEAAEPGAKVIRFI